MAVSIRKIYTTKQEWSCSENHKLKLIAKTEYLGQISQPFIFNFY